jgi:MarR family transcriptional regulator, lower aerobic nicotinate degradation pathway regulator
MEIDGRPPRGDRRRANDGPGMIATFLDESSHPAERSRPAPPTSPATAEEPTSNLEEPSYRLEESVGHLLRRAHQRHAALFQENTAEGAGLTPMQFAALVKLAEVGRVSQNRLGRLTGMDPATIQGVAQRLIGRGLVGAGRDPLDRRTVVLTPTSAGRALLAEAVARARRTNEAVLAPLSAAEQATLMALLRRLGNES